MDAHREEDSLDSRKVIVQWNPEPVTLPGMVKTQLSSCSFPSFLLQVTSIPVSCLQVLMYVKTNEIQFHSHYSLFSFLRFTFQIL